MEFGLIKSNTPLVHNGKTYDKFFINMAVSQRHIGKEQKFTASVSIRLTPCRQDPETHEVEMVAEKAKAIVFADVLQAASLDPDVANAVAQIITALYTFVDSKNL